MIASFVFLLHFLAAAYAFFKYRKEGIGEGLLAVAFVVIVFSVGWTITTVISKAVFPSDLVARWIAHLQDSRVSRSIAKELTVDTLSLVLLTIAEIFFYYFYLKSGGKKPTKETRGTTT